MRPPPEPRVGCARCRTSSIGASSSAAWPCLRRCPAAQGVVRGPWGVAVTRWNQHTGTPRAYPPLAPLGDATFARRYDRLRAFAREAGASVVFITNGTTSFAYLAGGKVERSDRLIALIRQLFSWITSSRPIARRPQVTSPQAETRCQMMRPISRYSWRAASTRSAVVIGRRASAAIRAARRAAFLM